MKHRHFLPIVLICISFFLGNCNLPRITINIDETATPSPIQPVDTAAPPPTAELGLAENPLILALPPSANKPEQINAAREIAAQFTERTGYVVLVIAPQSYAELMVALENGNAHIALLDALSYALAYQKELVNAQFAIIKDGDYQYGMQFLAARNSGLTSYFDETTGENTVNANIALTQLADKKPCWSEEISPSGYVVPLGMLDQAQVQIRPAAFVGGQTTVVRSLYAGGICDFGASYVDARKFPSLEDSMPDLVQQVKVIWRSPEIIPHGVVVFSNRMPLPMQALFHDLIPAIIQTDTGKVDFKTAFDIVEFQSVNDGDFREFHLYVRESRIDLGKLFK